MAEQKKKEEAKSFEEQLSRLEQVVRALEDTGTPLNDSLKLFEEGVGLVRNCTQMLDEAEKKVKILTRNPATGKVEEADLDE